MKITFNPSSEQKYHSSKNGSFIKNQRTFDVPDGLYNYLLSFYLVGSTVYAYFMGRYYVGTMEGDLSNVQEIDLLIEIKAQCSDPYKVKEEEIEEEIVD